VRVSVFYQAARGALFALTLWHKILNDVNAGRASERACTFPTRAPPASLETRPSTHPPTHSPIHPSISQTLSALYDTHYIIARPHDHLHFYACDSIALSAASIFFKACVNTHVCACEIDPIAELCIISADVGLEKREQAGDMKCYFSFLIYGGMQLFSLVHGEYSSS
jgi:hypothetical protein